ncbi:hypothetical protein BAnh1_09870 [Bartonella australis AUST/NH1]|uniref:Uncharacterized protein n=1 Tax=Bartonella australis (strain Aust/NH1) TaxID=1094489 RepID=M1N4N4_BARAA|nr:hypothetical protein BAnh1_09870 [Bartonella australis AUST/NH1]
MLNDGNKFPDRECTSFSPHTKVSKIEDIIKLASYTILQWIPLLTPKELLASANGHCICLPYSQLYVRFLYKCSLGIKIDIADLIFELSKIERRTCLDLTASLASWGALCQE